MADKKNPTALGESQIVWVLIPTFLAIFVKFVWIVAIAFIAMTYMMRSGREAKWFLWALHLCSLIVLIRIFGWVFLLSQVGEIPPPFTSKEDFVDRFGVLAYPALPEFGVAEQAVRERVMAIKQMDTVSSGDMDPFSGNPFPYVDNEAYRTYYSIGPDQIDQKLEVKYDIKEGVFTPGDVPAATVFIGDEATTGTVQESAS